MAGNSVLSPVSLTSYYRPEDGTVTQAKLYFYDAGTYDPISVWTDALLTIPHSQPVLTGGSGRVPPVFVGEIDAYRVVTYDEFDVLIEDIDGIPAAPPSADVLDPGDVDPLKLLPTGVICDFWENGNPKAGWVRCNGGTIGNLGSGATEMAAAEAQALFAYLWQDPNTVVQPSRGASSAGDWADITTYKRIVLPDLRGRTRVTFDGFGRTAAGRMTGAFYDFLTATAVGATGGRASHTNTVAEMAAHNHPLTDPTHTHTNAKAARHTHTYSGNTGNESADHTHSGTTGVNSRGHTHDYTLATNGTGLTVNSGAAWTPLQGLTGGTNTSDESQNHTHAFTTGGRSVAHTHAFSGTSAQNPDDATRNVTMDAVSTGITIDSSGGGAAFSLVPPFVQVATYIKL